MFHPNSPFPLLLQRVPVVFGNYLMGNIFHISGYFYTKSILIKSITRNKNFVALNMLIWTDHRLSWYWSDRNIESASRCAYSQRHSFPVHRVWYPAGAFRRWCPHFRSQADCHWCWASLNIDDLRCQQTIVRASKNSCTFFRWLQPGKFFCCKAIA